MKQILTILWLVFLTIMVNPTYAAETSETQSQQSAQPTWIEVGTVIGDAKIESYYNKGYSYNGSNELKLYVMYLGDKLIYRVQWNGSFYSVKQVEQVKSYNDNAAADIPDFLCIRAKKTDGSEYIKTKSATVYFTVPTW